MKKFLFSLICLISSLGAIAQHCDFYVGYGISPMHFGSNPAPWRDIAYDIKITYEDYGFYNPRYHEVLDKSMTNAVTAGFGVRVSPRVMLGGTYSYYEADCYTSYDEENFKCRLMHSTHKCHVFMMTGTYTWLNYKRFRLYSKAALGVRIDSKWWMNVYNDPFVKSPWDTEVPQIEDGFRYKYHAPERSDNFSWQLNPVGVDFHLIWKLYLYGEAGLGLQGFATVGVKTRF